MQKTVAMSVTEANIMATLSCAQDMMYAKLIMESFELKVKLPIILEVNNKGAFMSSKSSLILHGPIKLINASGS